MSKKAALEAPKQATKTDLSIKKPGLVKKVAEVKKAAEDAKPVYAGSEDIKKLPKFDSGKESTPKKVAAPASKAPEPPKIETKPAQEAKSAEAKKAEVQNKSEIKAKNDENDDEEEVHYNFKVPRLYPDNPTPRGAGLTAKAKAKDQDSKPSAVAEPKAVKPAADQGKGQKDGQAAANHA